MNVTGWNKEAPHKLFLILFKIPAVSLIVEADGRVSVKVRSGR